MSPNDEPPAWWALHLRRARGEVLTPEEQRWYDAEMNRQDQDAPALKNGVAALKLLRKQIIHLVSDNPELRTTLAQLEEERERVEQALSPEARQLLGVGE